MFINKINGVSNLGFKGYQHVKNDVGEDIYRFNYPYDYAKEDCEVQIFRAVPNEKLNYTISETPIATIKLEPQGVNVNLQDITNLDKDAPFAYKIVRRNKADGSIIWEGPDTGMNMKAGKNGDYVFRTNVDKGGDADFEDRIAGYKYSLVARRGTTPRVQGAGYLVMPDGLKPGVMYRGFTDSNTGEIYYDKDYQKKMEGVIKTFANKLGGNIAGMQSMIPYLKQNGYTYMFSTPIANGDNVSSHRYWNKNNMQIAPDMGNTENFASFMRDLYSNGMKYVYDGTFTSEGLEGVHFQYALRWAEKNPQTYYWFRMSSIKDTNLGFGTVPKNKENLRHRVINAPYIYTQNDSGKIEKKANPNYDSNKETLFQIYDASQVDSEQIKDLDNAINTYKNLKSGKELDIVTHDDTLVNYICQIDPKEYQKRVDVINDLNKTYGKNIQLDSADGTILVSQFSNFKIDKKTEGGFVAWDANTDMVKMNYHISGYDEKINQAIVDRTKRDLEKQMIERGTYEVQDLAIQSGKYWTGKVKNIQTLYTAQTVGKAKTVDGINKLIDEGKLPQNANITEPVLNNILNGQYLLEPKGILDKDSVTVKSLMSLPLDTLEFGENTVGVLSTSYFSNRATSEDTIGISRFDLMKQNNPHLVEPYAKTYNRVNGLYNNELKDFADSIIKKVNDKSDEKLLDVNGDYTEYGEYVMELVGQDIAKYALLKSLSGKAFNSKILDNGEITYDYESIRNATSLKAIGIKAYNPDDEALQLEKKIEKGLKSLSDSDITYVADSINKRIAGTDTMSFRIAEAAVDRASLGLDWRLDAAKDVIDMDSVRNNDTDFDDAWNQAIAFWSKFVQAVKSENPNSYIVAELTDIPDLLRAHTGAESCPYRDQTNIGQRYNGEPDAMAKFFNETGITTEAGYSYFFTNLLTSFAPAFDDGTSISETHDGFKQRLDLLMQTRSADYIRNLWTFMDNHDKPRMIHGLALDMGLFHSSLKHGYKNGHAEFEGNRSYRQDMMRALTGARTNTELPLELRLNIDNNEYFRTTSSRAAAMTNVLMAAVYEDLNGIASEEDKKRLIDALVDLTNGNYLGEGQTLSPAVINVPELSSLENAFEALLKTAENSYGLKLSEAERKQIFDNVIKIANSDDMMNNYLVHGGFDWAGPNEDIGKANRERADRILGSVSDYSQYSLYTVNLASLLLDSYTKTGKNPAAKEALTKAAKEFVEKYDRDYVQRNSSELPKIEDPKTGMRKLGYSARDIKVAMSMAIKQAEYKSGKPIANKEAIVDTVFKSVTEPAVKKAAMITEYLKGLPGVPTNYAGDELGMSGYEEKAKNVYLQNRNALPWTDVESDSDIGKYRKSIMASINGALKDRSNPELHALNDGTPYAMDVTIGGRNRDALYQRFYEVKGALEKDPQNEALQNEKRQLTQALAKVAYMMQSANGDMTVTLFNAGGIDHKNRVDYFAKYGLDTDAKRKKFFADNDIESINPNNKYVPIQPKSEVDYLLLGAGVAVPVGTVFTNANVRDKAKYVVKEINGQLGIFKEGGKIVLSDLTAKNGVMILKHIKNIAFKGHRTYYNPQYNFVSNPYKKQEVQEEGKRLSIISK